MECFWWQLYHKFVSLPSSCRGFVFLVEFSHCCPLLAYPLLVLFDFGASDNLLLSVSIYGVFSRKIGSCPLTPGCYFISQHAELLFEEFISS